MQNWYENDDSRIYWRAHSSETPIRMYIEGYYNLGGEILAPSKQNFLNQVERCNSDDYWESSEANAEVVVAIAEVFFMVRELAKGGYEVLKYADDLADDVARTATKIDDVVNISNKFDDVYIDSNKLRYLTELDSGKAKGFEILGYTTKNIDELERMLQLSRGSIGEVAEVTQYGTKYNVVMQVTGPNGHV